jgi:ATP-dependent DNA helicase RecG
MIEESLKFVRRNTTAGQIVTGDSRHQDLHEYPLVAVREAVVNAVMHRDYYYDGSHTFIHIFSDRLEIESPGGLPVGLRPEDLGKHSVRRNRTIADLLYRVKYVERIGSGIQRMERALADNGNPAMEISATNFFVVRFYPRIEQAGAIALTSRQAKIYRLAADRGSLTKAEVAKLLGVSGDTALRDMNALVRAGVLERQGVGRGTKYVPAERGVSRP